MSDTAEQTDDIDIMELDDDAFETRLAQIEEQLEDNKENDGDVDEHKALLDQRTEVRQQQQAATKERDTRQKGLREALKDIRAEATRIETKLATELTPDDEAELRARREYIADRRVTLEASMPFAGIPNDTLEARIEENEYQRDEVRDALDKIHSPGSKPNAHARRLQAELKALDEGRRALSVELETRRLQGANKELAHRAAVRDAERELRAEDAKAISEADEARRGTKTEDLAETFAARLALRIPEVEQRLWQQAERNVVSAFGHPYGGVEAGGGTRAKKMREDQAKLDEWRQRYEQASQ